jgi:hypothetical protein
MSVTESDFRALEKTLREIGGHLETEPWKDDHDRAMDCRDLEGGISTTLPLLNILAATLKELGRAITSGATLNVSSLYILRESCTMFSAIHDHALEWLRDLEQAGYRVDQAGEFKVQLRAIHGILNPIGRILEEAEFRLPVPPGEQPSSHLPEQSVLPADQPAPGDPPRPFYRLPDPPFCTEEQPAPFDLPLFGTRVRIMGRLGPVRLPDPIDESEG